MKTIALLVVATLAISGCGKRSETSAPSPGQTEVDAKTGQPIAPPPKYVTANAQNALAQNVDGEVNEFLTEQLKLFVKRKGRLPESFTEFTKTGIDSIPRPPAGMKWVIDSASVQVKAAKQ